MKKVSASSYVEKVEEIYRSNPSYESGHDGSDGSCDCIGLPRGALDRAGATGVHNMRGTNNAARHLDLNLQPLSSASQLRVGDIVMKTRDKDDPDMPLPDQYRKGGNDYSSQWGETNFTHIGTVTKINPLEITHMTSPHAKKDSSIKGWGYYGELPWVDYSDSPDPGPDPEPDPEPEPQPVEEMATVWSENGKHVHLRQKKSTSSKVVDDVPYGAVVTVLSRGDEWCKVKYVDRVGAIWYGYMMTKFLRFFSDDGDDEGGEVITQTYIVHIPYLTEYQADALIKQYSGSYKTVGERTVG